MRLKHIWKSGIAAAGLMWLAVPVFADDAPAEKVPPALVSLQAYPSTIKLDSASDAERFIIVATYADGITRDVTHEAEIKLAPDNIVKVSPDFKLLPATDGEGAANPEGEPEAAASAESGPEPDGGEEGTEE